MSLAMQIRLALARAKRFQAEVSAEAGEQQPSRATPPTATTGSRTRGHRGDGATAQRSAPERRARHMKEWFAPPTAPTGCGLRPFVENLKGCLAESPGAI